MLVGLLAVPRLPLLGTRGLWPKQGSCELNWDGRRVPDELRKLPPGHYAIAPVDQSPSLTDDEEAGVRAGLDELDAGPEIVLRDGRRVRNWPVPPYRIYYRRRGDFFEIVRVYHQARRPIER